MFLKRAAFGHIQSEDLYLGAILNVYSRQVKIVEYADVFTRNELEGKVPYPRAREARCIPAPRQDHRRGLQDEFHHLADAYGQDD